MCSWHSAIESVNLRRYPLERRAALKKSEQTYFALIVEYLEKVDELIEK